MQYVDVFISHKMEDTQKAVALKKKIEGWKFTCYIDADDKELQQIQTGEAGNDRELATRVRQHLRVGRCMIYAFSARSLKSRWMQWELGFFDGRWGPRQIGLYDLDEGQGTALARGMRGKADGRDLGVPEYLEIYTELRPETLKRFLTDACSTRGLSDRADVDVDRFASLMGGMLRDTLNVTIDAWQFWVSYQQQFWKAFAPVPSADTFIRMSEDFRITLTPWAQMMRIPSNVADAWVTPFAKASAVAQGGSR